MLKELENYLIDGFHKVEGWVAEPIWEVLGFLDAIQRLRGITGGVAEIGVHHGRFLFGLQALKSDTPKAVAMDLFDNQEFNIDNSGRGAKQQFLTNAAHYSVDPAQIEIIQGDSLMMRQWDIDRVRDRHGRFSLFSVDGGHTVAHVRHDFDIAQELTVPGGLIIIDDYNNPFWPGVQEGIAMTFLMQNPTFVPILCGMNKLILADISHHDIYYKALAAYFSKYPGVNMKLNTRFGWNNVSLTLPDRKPHFAVLREWQAKEISTLKI
ncbi:MAG: class I SAM-dependent methyltransferase [Hyphomonas sp.]